MVGSTSFPLGSASCGVENSGCVGVMCGFPSDLVPPSHPLLRPHLECGPSRKCLVIKSHGSAQRGGGPLLRQLDLKRGFCECGGL